MLITFLYDQVAALRCEWCRAAKSQRQRLVLLWETQRVILHVLTFASWEEFYGRSAGNWLPSTVIRSTSIAFCEPRSAGRDEGDEGRFQVKLSH